MPDPVATQMVDRMLGTYVGSRPECPLCLGTGHVTRTLADNLSDDLREKAEAIAGSYAYPTRYRLIAATLLLAGNTRDAAATLGISRTRVHQVINS